MKALIITFWTDEKEDFFYINDRFIDMIFEDMISFFSFKEHFFLENDALSVYTKCESVVDTVEEIFLQDEMECGLLILPEDMRQNILRYFLDLGWRREEEVGGEDDFVLFPQRNDPVFSKRCYISEEEVGDEGRKDNEVKCFLQIDKEGTNFSFSEN